MSQSKGKILVVSDNPKLADIRKKALENAGFTVIPAMNDSAVEKACSSNGIPLLILGYLLAPSAARGGNHGNTATFPYWNCIRAVRLSE